MKILHLSQLDYVNHSKIGLIKAAPSVVPTDRSQITRRHASSVLAHALSSRTLIADVALILRIRPLSGTRQDGASHRAVRAAAAGAHRICLQVYEELEGADYSGRDCPQGSTGKVWKQEACSHHRHEFRPWTENCRGAAPNREVPRCRGRA
eukprot:4637093-Pleurochrysis_carterae.AAC.2